MAVMMDAPAPWRLEVYDTLGSTSDLCRARAASGEPEGLAVLAHLQTAGRGSRGRTWLSAPGNLFVSLLLRPSGPARDAGLWALLSGVVVAEALDRPGVVLKWPNDVLFHGHKICGILIDSAASASGELDWLIYGIGVNLAVAPEIEGRTAAAFGDGLAPETVARAIMARLSHWLAVQRRAGWADIRQAWLDRALPVGAETTLRRGEEIIAGVFAGLADDGSLLLQTGGRVQAFSSGEVWLPTTQERETPTC